MNFTNFQDEMNDILTSGSGIELSNWHKGQIRELFLKVEDKNILFEYLNSYYNIQDVEDIMGDEIGFICDELGLNVKTSIQFSWK